MPKDTEQLKAIAEGILALKELKTSSAERCDAGGRFVAKAIEHGAFSGTEHIDLRVHVEMRLSHTHVNAFISAWKETVIRLRYGQGPYPSLETDFDEDCEVIAQAIQREADAALQEPPTKATKPTPKTDPTLIYQSVAADLYDIPKSTLSKAGRKQPGEFGYLWSGKDGRRTFYRKADLEKLSQSRKKLAKG